MRNVLRAVVPAMVLVVPIMWMGFAAGSVEKGSAAFQKRCKMCHGADGAGNPAMARMLKVEFQAMDSDHVQSLKDEELKNIITKGKGKMTAVRGVDDAELSDLVAYLRSLKKK